MKETLTSLQEINIGGIKNYHYEELCPYPFDKTMTLKPFPKKLDMPKFDKYKGKEDPWDHVKDFYMAFQKVSYSDNYLIILFPKSLGGQALERFTCFPYGSIFTWPKLTERFVHHFSYNIESDVTLADLCGAKQFPNETFNRFL